MENGAAFFAGHHRDYPRRQTLHSEPPAATFQHNQGDILPRIYTLIGEIHSYSQKLVRDFAELKQRQAEFEAAVLAKFSEIESGLSNNSAIKAKSGQRYVPNEMH